MPLSVICDDPNILNEPKIVLITDAVKDYLGLNSTDSDADRETYNLARAVFCARLRKQPIPSATQTVLDSLQLEERNKVEIFACAVITVAATCQLYDIDIKAKHVCAK